MFSGIIEAVVPALSQEAGNSVVYLALQRPSDFNDIKSGDSIAVNGVCLTVEKFDQQSITFALAAETLKILKWNPETFPTKVFNLERSLRFGDRMHGHMVSGHVDSLGEVTRVFFEGDSLHLDISIASNLRPYVWLKGSLTIHGVSLTVNSVKDDVVSVCLIPETQIRTNLSKLTAGDFVNIEPDLIARAVVRALETGVIPGNAR